MRVLLAFDKFKDAISAHDACHIAAAALHEIHPDWELDLCPLTDGGEGFARILTESVAGELHSTKVTGPKGPPVSARFGLVPWRNIPAVAQNRLALPAGIEADAKIAIIEMAAASGLALLAPQDRNPWLTTSAGTGELMRHAASLGAEALLVGIGGSATNDLGLGALSALGLEFVSDSNEVGPLPLPQHWERITRIRGSVPADFPPVRVACDVTNPLLGPKGCAAVYGPQKGLAPGDLARMEQSSQRMAGLLCAYCGMKDEMVDTAGAGAAGGIAFGLMVGAKARLLSGFALTVDWFNLEKRIRAADVVLTGEGHFDESSAEGKGPGAIFATAAEARKNVHVFAGKISAALSSNNRLHAITPPSWTLQDALQATPELLRGAVRNHFSA